MSLSEKGGAKGRKKGKQTAEDEVPSGRGKKKRRGGATGLNRAEPALSAVQLHWVINRKKNGPLYHSGAGQESSADVIKILSSPVKDTYHSSSARLALSEKENQPNRWGLSFHSCKRD